MKLEQEPSMSISTMPLEPHSHNLIRHIALQGNCIRTCNILIGNGNMEAIGVHLES